jgi:hypothetical protein
MNGLLWSGLAFVMTLMGLYVDDPLESEARSVLASVPERITNRAVFFQAGLDAPDGIDPVFYGRYRVESSQAHGFAYTSASLEGIQSATLPAPKGPLFCSTLGEAPCWRRIAFVKADQVDALQTEHATLLERYQTWLGMASSEKHGPPRASENLPADHLANVHRIVVLRALADAEAGQAEAAAQSMREAIIRLRQHLATEDDLSAKMLLTDMIAEGIDALSMISQAHQMNRIALKPMTPAEQDLTPSMANQFKLAYRFFLSPRDSSLDRLGRSGLDAQQPAAINRLDRFVYKPIATVNLNFQDIRYWIEASRLEPSDFAELLSQPPKPTVWRTLGRLRNPVGHAMVQMMQPNFKEPIARLHALGMRIDMFNAVHVQSADGAQPKPAANPYGQGLPSMIRADPSAVCMPVPEVIDVKAVCLRLTA